MSHYRIYFFPITKHSFYHVRFIILFLIPFCFYQISQAQETTAEFWPEIDIWLRVSPSWRFSMFVPISKNLETKYREGNLILQVDAAWAKTKRMHLRRFYDENRAREMKIMLSRVGYLGAKSLNEKGEAYEEKMAFFEQHFRIPIKHFWLISHRLRPEFRWIGEDNDMSYRIRYRFMIEKEITLKKIAWVPYVNVEPYYDSRYESVNRVRAIGGTSVIWSPRFLLEGNVTYQYDSRSSVTNLYALNLILHIFFKTTGITKEKTSTGTLMNYRIINKNTGDDGIMIYVSRNFFENKTEDFIHNLLSEGTRIHFHNGNHCLKS